MGVICSSKLLVRLVYSSKRSLTNCTQQLVPALIESIKVAGLVLISDISDPDHELGKANLQSSSSQGVSHGIDGVFKADGVLRFTETIDL